MVLLRRIANLFRCSRIDREIDDELRTHVEMRIEDNIVAGGRAAGCAVAVRKSHDYEGMCDRGRCQLRRGQPLAGSSICGAAVVKIACICCYDGA